MNLAHTVAELRKAQAALTPLPHPEPPQPAPPQLASHWTQGVVTGLSANGWPVMEGKEYPIYGVNPIADSVARAHFLDWLVKTHGRKLACRQHEQSGSYDCRVTASSAAGSAPLFVDVADTLVKNAATTRPAGAGSN